MFCWWYYGGYRIGENSDFGIVDPDGGIRPVTRVISEYASKFLNQPAQQSPDVILKIDRDLHSDGLRSMYRSVEEELFQAIDDGKTVAFEDGSSNTTSADVPMTEVGNFEYSGCCPKYLDGIITGLTANGKEFANGATIEARNGESVTLVIDLQNTTYAKWLCDGHGAVSLVSDEASDVSFKLDIPHTLDKLGRVKLTLTAGSDCQTISGKLMAAGRGVFGDRLRLHVVRD